MGFFIFTLALLVLAIIATIVGRRVTKGDSSLSGARSVGTAIGVVVSLLLFAGLLAQSYVQTEPNHYKVQTFAGSVQNVTSPGWTFSPPWYTNTDFDCTVRTYTMATDNVTGEASDDADEKAINVPTSDISRSNVDITVRYSCDGSGIGELYEDYRNDFEGRIIRNDIRSVVRDAFVEYGAAEGRAQRAEIGDEIEEALSERWEGLFIVNEVNIREVALAPEVQQAADRALVAEAAARERGFVLLEEEVNADIVRVQNQAVRDGQQIILCGGTTQTVQNSLGEDVERIIPNEGDDCEVQLSPELLQWKCLETTEAIFSDQSGTDADNRLLYPLDCGLGFGQTSADLIPEPRVDVPVGE